MLACRTTQRWLCQYSRIWVRTKSPGAEQQGQEWVRYKPLLVSLWPTSPCAASSPAVIFYHSQMALQEQTSKGLPPSKYLCLTILGYRKPGMSEEDYRRHMTEVSAPLTKDLMAKHGIKRWTVMHTPQATRELMSQLYDHQMANVADYDCFSQVVFESLEHYKNLKEDPWYKSRLFGDHEKFADTNRSK
ncbi:hypothetical protein ACJQWK_06144 [Exserohilum turcicum]